MTQEAGPFAAQNRRPREQVTQTTGAGHADGRLLRSHSQTGEHAGDHPEPIQRRGSAVPALAHLHAPPPARRQTAGRATAVRATGHSPAHAACGPAGVGVRGLHQLSSEAPKAGPRISDAVALNECWLHWMTTRQDEVRDLLEFRGIVQEKIAAFAAERRTSGDLQAPREGEAFSRRHFGIDRRRGTSSSTTHWPERLTTAPWRRRSGPASRRSSFP